MSAQYRITTPPGAGVIQFLRVIGVLDLIGGPFAALMFMSMAKEWALITAVALFLGSLIVAVLAFAAASIVESLIGIRHNMEALVLLAETRPN